MTREIGTQEGGRDWGAIIPGFLDDYGLDPYEMRVYVRLARRAGMGGQCWESVGNMAKACKMSQQTVRNCLTLLNAANLIRQIKRPGSSDLYELMSEQHWVEATELDALRKQVTAYRTASDQKRRLLYQTQTSSNEPHYDVVSYDVVTTPLRRSDPPHYDVVTKESLIKNSLNTSQEELPPNPPPQKSDENKSDKLKKLDFERQVQTLATLSNQPRVLVSPLIPDEDSSSGDTSLGSDLEIKKSLDDLERSLQHSKPSKSSSKQLNPSARRKNDDFERNKEALPPWRCSWQPNSYHKGFVQYLQAHYLPKVGRWKETGEKPARGDAKNWIAGRESRGESALVENKWEDYQEQSMKQTQAQSPPAETHHRVLRPGDLSVIENESLCREYYKLGREEFLKAADWHSIWLKDAEKFVRFKNIMQGREHGAITN